MTDTDPLQALDQRIDAWLRHVYDPQTKPLEPDEPIDPRCVALHADLRALEQRCTLEGWPAALRNRLRVLRDRLRGKRLVEDPDPVGLLACRKCGGGMSIIEIFVLNHKVPDHMLTDIFPWDPPDNVHEGATLAIILGKHDPGAAGRSDYAVGNYPGDEDTQGVEFYLQCTSCDARYMFMVHITAEGKTRFYWDDWRENTEEGTA